MSHQLPAVQTTDTAIAERLAYHRHAARGAYSPNTERALRADSAVFAAWCVEHHVASMPATPATVAAFVDAMADTRAPATVRRYVASIATMHRHAGVENACAAEEVRLALKRMHHTHGTRQRQAPALTRPLVDRMLAATGERLIDARDRAILAVAYDTLCRRTELVAFDVADVLMADDGTATVLVKRSKTDQDGAGMVRFLAVDTVRHLVAWLATAGHTAGRLFRSVTKSGLVGGGLDAGEVAAIFRKLATRAGLTVRPSGHSTRVGAAQDMVAAGLELGEIMRAGGWRTPTMPARYSEHLAARRSASAKLAGLQNRL